MNRRGRQVSVICSLTEGQTTRGYPQSQAILKSLVTVRGSSTFSALGYGCDGDASLLAKKASTALTSGVKERAEREAQDMVALSRALMGKRQSNFRAQNRSPTFINLAQRAGITVVHESARNSS